MLLQFIKLNSFLLTLAAITLLGALLRFPYLDQIPPAMLQDEVALGYNAISIAQTGTDEWGQRFPIVFRSFGDDKPPGFFYATSLLYLLIGWQPVLPRLTSAIAGTLLIIVGSLWIKKLFNPEKSANQLALFAGLLLAISPWTIHLSRMALESNLALLFFFCGLYFFEFGQAGRRSQSIAKSIAAALFLAASTYTFHSYRYTVALLFFGLLLTTYIFKNWLRSKITYQVNHIWLVLIISSVLALPGFFGSGTSTRLSQTFLPSTAASKQLYTFYQNNCYITLTNLARPLLPLCRLEYNKIMNPLMILGSSYADHLSPNFAFFSGDPGFGRNPTALGELYLILFPLWIIGGYFVLTQYKKYYPLILGYLISLIPSAVSGPTHSTRLSVHLPFLIAVIIFGYQFLYSKSHRLAIALWVMLFVFLGYFVMNYSTATYANSQDFLGHGKELAESIYPYFEQNYTIYMDEDLIAEPHIYFAYWNRLDPVVYHQLRGESPEDTYGFSRPLQLGENLLFHQANINKLVCDPSYTTPTLFVTRQAMLFSPQKVIRNNTQALRLVELYELSEMRKQTKVLTAYCLEDKVGNQTTQGQ